MLTCPVPLLSSLLIWCNFYDFFSYRTIMNCNLKVIQARAFAQNPHLRYMWVWASSSVTAMFSSAVQTYSTWHFAAVSGWISVSEDAAVAWDRLLRGRCGSASNVAMAAHLKWDIHYLPGIIGLLSAAPLCALAEEHAKDALPFSACSPNGPFREEAAHQRAGPRTRQFL